MPSGSLRIGRADRTTFTIGVARNIPLFTGGGLVDLGLGFSLSPSRSRLWIGLAAVPYDGGAFSLKGDFQIHDHFILNVRTQVGLGHGSQYGLGVGSKIVF